MYMAICACLDVHAYVHAYMYMPRCAYPPAAVSLGVRLSVARPSPPLASIASANVDRDARSTPRRRLWPLQAAAGILPKPGGMAAVPQGPIAKRSTARPQRREHVAREHARPPQAFWRRPPPEQRAPRTSWIRRRFLPAASTRRRGQLAERISRARRRPRGSRALPPAALPPAAHISREPRLDVVRRGAHARRVPRRPRPVPHARRRQDVAVRHRRSRREVQHHGPPACGLWHRSVAKGVWYLEAVAFRGRALLARNLPMVAG